MTSVSPVALSGISSGMITLGIVLFVIGALVAWFARNDVGRLGYFVAVIGVVLIVLGVVLSLVDDDTATAILRL